MTTFDYDKGEIRLAINKYAPSGITVEYKMSGWKIFLIIVGCLVAVAILICLIVCLCKRCKKRKLKQGYETISALSQEDEVKANVEPKDPGYYKQHYNQNRPKSNSVLIHDED